MKIKKMILPTIIGLGVLIFSSVCMVKEGEQAIVLQFSNPIKIIAEPGLHFKMPFMQDVKYFDKRTLGLETSPKEVIAADTKRLVVDAFARYRINDPLKFYKTVRTERLIKERLKTMVDLSIRNRVSQINSTSLISKERNKVLDKIKQEIEEKAKEFGVKIVDVRIKRIDLPPELSNSVYERMRTEREREAKEFRAEGAEISAKITSEADKQATIIIAEAQRTATILRGEGDAKASRIYANAFGRDPKFYSFYRSMEAYKKGFNNKPLILSLDSEFFKHLNSSK